MEANEGGQNFCDIFTIPSSDGSSHLGVPPWHEVRFEDEPDIWERERQCFVKTAAESEGVVNILVEGSQFAKIDPTSTDQIIEVLYQRKNLLTTEPEISITICNGEKHCSGTRRPLPLSVRQYLLQWLDDNSNNPYPSPSDWEILMKNTNLSRKKISTFFVNNRSRYLKRSPKMGKSGSGKREYAALDAEDAVVPSRARTDTAISYPEDEINI